MSLSIIKPGLLDTIQDMGRFGFGNWGINPAGVMDSYAMQVANILVGNCAGEAVMEIHFPGPQILFEQNALISIAGADFSPTINDEPIPLCQPVIVRKNTLLQFSKHNAGARSYLAVNGGFDVCKWLNSASTNLKAAVGGWQGRRLEKNDALQFKDSTIYFSGLLNDSDNMKCFPWRANVTNTYSSSNEIFIIEGNEWQQLNEDAQQAFTKNNFIIHHLSDRMGYQLKGIELPLKEKTELVSSAVGFGTLQLLPNGQLIILMADHQTTGGYPRMGHVITAHLPKLAQAMPGDAIQFKFVDVDTAWQLLFSQQRELQILKRACTDHLNQLVC